MIKSSVGRFEEQSSVTNRPGRDAHRNIHTKDNVETARHSVAENPSVSTRRRSSQLGCSRMTLQDKVYVNKEMAIRKLKENIRDEILSLQPETLRGVMKTR
ncbi:hypothetical protein TNIN_21111 [Trichonephila inaurata madagascariensis]|uniref:Uncharacterized protein n=1 Tax=Trichonephila inaurata madagascariensis TaxID=2747483 RepID=A0A8X7C4X5_9ARAC|nr:hypothetical protein TNIN_21111 [Trichonephila inaurata madagascariensis]